MYRVHTKWPEGLAAAQVATARAIRRHHNGSRESDGWMLYRIPSTGQARYVELRHYLTGGRVARWVIELDGTVSATNELGERKALHGSR